MTTDMLPNWFSAKFSLIFINFIVKKLLNPANVMTIDITECVTTQPASYNLKRRPLKNT